MAISKEKLAGLKNKVYICKRKVERISTNNLKQKTMNNLGKLVVFAVVIAASFLTSLLGAYVLLDIAALYNLSFITQFTFIQMYGIFCVYSVFSYKYKEIEEEEERQKKGFGESFIRVFTTAFFYLCVWGIAYVALAIMI